VSGRAATAAKPAISKAKGAQKAKQEAPAKVKQADNGEEKKKHNPHSRMQNMLMVQQELKLHKTLLMTTFQRLTLLITNRSLIFCMPMIMLQKIPSQ